jgi:competence protein ComEA
MNTSRVELVRRAVRRRVSRGTHLLPHHFTVLAASPSLELARARWQVWAPLGLRALALLVALLGLAGIGSVAARAPRSAVPVAARAGLELASLAVPELAGAAGVETLVSPGPAISAAPATPPGPAVSAAPAPAPPGQAGPPAPGAPCPTLPSESAGVAGRVDTLAERAPVVLNRATAEELQRLPGVGAKRASAILALRQRLGRFQRKGDLLRVKGIGPRTLERLLPHIALD